MQRGTSKGAWKQGFSFELLGAVVLTLMVLFGLWKAVAPGIALEWSLQGDGVSAFRIYRAKASQQNFELISEIPAKAGVTNYSYVDVRLLPGGEYVYRVEGVGLAGDLAVSKSITSNSIGVLPGQLAILFASCLIGLASINVFSVLRQHVWTSTGRPQFT